MIVVEYPVAAVMKAWQTLFSGVFSLAETTAWVWSIPLLVFTIRLLLFPIAFRQLRSGRVLANIRPQLRALSEEYKGKKDKESRKKAAEERKRLHAENNYHVRDGCLPMLIQIPVLIGLYRLLLRIARPQEGLHAAHNGYGPLSAEDIDTFLEARFLNVPLPAYVSMPDKALAGLGTSSDEVLKIALPLIIMASVLTTTNYITSLLRSRRQMDYGQTAAHFFMKLMWLMGPMILIFPWFLGLFGPAPLALLMYWVCNNLWTITQNMLTYMWLNKHLPFTDEFKEHFHEQKALFKEQKHQKRHGKHALRKNHAKKGREAEGPAEKSTGESSAL